MKRALRYLLALAALATPLGVRGQAYQNHLHVQNCATWTPQQLVQNILVGEGVVVDNVRFNGSYGTINCDAIGTFYTDSNAATTEIGLREGILITTGNIHGAPGPNTSARLTTPYSGAPYTDTSLQAIAGQDDNGNPYQLYHTSVLEFDFVPQTDSVGFRYIFASEEYPEYVGAPYNDIFAFLVTGPKPGGGTYHDTNIAIIPGTNQPVRIATVNSYVNQLYYVDNYGAPFDNNWRSNRQVEYDGFTTEMTAFVRVVPCSTYHMRISLSDVNDSTFDSGVFLEAGSLSAKSIEVSFRNADSSSTDSRDILETCCLDMVVKLLNPNTTRRTLQMYRTHNQGIFTAGAGDYTITPNVGSTNANSPSTFTFPQGVDSLVFHLCGTADEIYESIEHFRLAYRLQGDCSFLMDTFNIVNVVPLTLNTPLPGETGSNVTIIAYNNGGVPPYTYTWVNLLTGDTVYTSGTGGQSSINVPLEPLRQYNICVTDACGTTTCSPCAVGPTPIFIDTSTHYDTVCVGSTATLTCTGATTYEWYYGTNTSTSPRGTGATFTTPAVNGNTLYTLVAYHDTLGMTWMNTRRYYIYVESLPTVTVRDNDHNRQSSGNLTTYACNGERVHLSATHSSSSTLRWGTSGPFGDPDTHSVMPTPATATNSTGTTLVHLSVQEPAPRHCPAERDITIVTYMRPTLSASPDIEICTTATFTLQAVPSTIPGAMYWHDGNTTRKSTGTWANLRPTASTDYIIHAATGGNNVTCEVTDTVHVTVWPKPTLTTSANPSPACSGETVTLTGGGASTYIWKRGSATVGTTAVTTVTNSNSNVTAPASVVYQLQGTDIHGCSNTQNLTLQVHSVPTVGLTATPSPLCVGGTVHLTATGARYYSWDSTSWTGVQSTATTTRTLDSAGTNTLYAWGYNTLERCNSHGQAQVNVLAYPTVNITADADSVCAGSSTTLHLSGAAEYSVGDTLHFSTSATRTVTPTGTGTTYTVYGRTASHICISSATIRIGVLPLPSVTLSASDTNLCNGQSATLVATGGGSYNWTVGSSTTPLGHHGDTLVVTPTSSTQYTVEGLSTGYSPCSTRQTVNINVYNYPLLTAMPDSGVCAGDALVLRATPRTASGVTYWYTVEGGSGSALGMGSQARWTLTPADSAVYVIHASRGPGYLCQASDTVQVDRYPLPVLTTAASPAIICSGDTAVLTASGAATYTWSGSNIVTQGNGTARVSPTNAYVDSATMNYSLYATDSHQCHNTAIQAVVVHSVPTISLQLTQTEFCVGDNLLRTATGARYYSWDSASWVGPYTNAYSSTLPLTAVGPDTLHLWGSNSRHACNNHVQRSIEVFSYPVVHVEASADTLCAGDEVTLTLSGAAQYSVNGSAFSSATTRTYTLNSTTEFIVHGRLANGLCDATDTVTVHVLPLPQIQVTPSAYAICQGDSVTLTAANTGTGGASGFRWYIQGDNTPLTNDSNAIQRFAPTATTTYRVTGITEGHVRCQNNGSVTVTVFQRPTLTVMGDTALCHHQTLPLQATATSTTPPIRYSHWGPGHSGVQQTAGSGQTVTWNFAADSVGTQQYIVSASTGPDSLCRISDTVEVLVRPLPNVTLTPDRHELCDGDTLHLTGAGATTYSWDNTQTFTPTNTQAFPPTVGSHLYTLYGDDTYGCRNHDTTQITVYGYPSTQLASNLYDICHGSTVALTANGAQHYSWDGGNSWRNAQPSTGVDTLTRILYDSITLYVEGYNLSPLCQVRDSVRVRVYSYPVMTWVADTDQICLNDTVHLTATGAVEYSFDNGLTWGAGNTISYVPSTPMTHSYRVIGRSEGPGCQTPVDINIQVHPLPNLQLSVSNSAFCLDSIITLTATGGERYRLYQATDTVVPPYSTTSQWTEQPDSSTTYIVDCLTQFNCFATTQHSIEVWTGRFQLFCEDTIVCEHGHVAVSAQGMEYYYWNGSTIPDTHNVYIFTVDTSSDFTVYGTDSHGCHGEETLHVDVYPNPHLQLAADTLGTCVGGTVNILASGAGEYIYHWDSPVPTVDSTHPALVTDTTWFTVTGIEGNLRCHSTDSIQIIAYPLPPVGLTGDQRDICDGDTLVLTATGADRYSWVEGSAYLPANTRTDVPAADSIYLVWGEEDTYHCRNYDTTLVHWFGHPAVSLAAERTKLCQGDSVLLTFGNAPFYDFDHSGSLTTATSVMVHPDSTTLYHLHADLRNPRFCGSDTTLLIEVFPIPEVQISASDTELCYGDTVTLSGTGAAYYAWLDDTTHLAPDTLRVPLYHSGTLHLSGTIANRLCYNEDSIHVTVYDPRVRLNPQAWEICNGGSMTISATGSDRYRWTDEGDFTDSTSHSYTFSSNGSVSSQTFIHVAGETANHLCQADTTISIVVYPGPNIHLTIEDVDSIGPRTWEVCAGDSVTFFATGGYFYRFPGQTEATRPVRCLYHPQPAGPDTSIYVLYGENFNHQCSGYDSLTIIVNPLPDVSLAVSRTLVCEGDSVRLSASGAVQYSWFAPGNYGIDTVRTVAVDETTQFLLWGRDNKLCRNYDTLTVTAFPFPQVHLTASADTLCQGFSTTLTATGGTAYAWMRDYPDDTDYVSQNSVTLSPMHDTVVYVWGNNFNGLCATLDSLRITVLPVPTVQIAADRNAICWGDTAHLTAICSESTWSWDNGPYGSAGIDVAPHDSTWYHVTTLAANGCYAYDSLLVEVRPFYNVDLHGDTNVCSGDSLWLVATGSNLYAWGDETTFGSEAGRYVTPMHDTVIIVRGTPRDSVCRAADTLPIHVYQRPNLYVDPETTTVCLGDSIVLSASGCEQYLWMDETEFGLHNGYHVYWPEHSMTYTVTGSMPGGVCVVTAPIEMIVIDTPIVQFYGPTDICLGDSVHLTASGGERYAWQGDGYTTSGAFHDMPDTLGTFTYHVAARVHTLNCTGHASIAVNVHPVPVLTLSANDSVICHGKSATLLAEGAYQYSWTMGNSYTPNDQMVVTPPQTTTYTVYATDSMMLCADTQSLTILVNPLPVVSLTPDTTEFCLGGSLSLTASGADAYAWTRSTPDGTAFGNVTYQTLTPQIDTVVNVWGIDSNGCINHDSVHITLHTPFQPYQHDGHHVAIHLYPTVTATISHSQICLGDSVTITGSGAQHYRWLDYFNSTSNPVYDNPNANRVYTVEGSMEYGCPDTATVSVEVFLYPPVSLQAADTLLCEGDTLHLFASGAPRYLWPGASAFGSDSTHNIVSPVGTHTYVLQGATENLLCAASDAIHVTVYPYPDMAIHGATRWCEGSEVTLAVENPADTLWWSATPADASLAGQEQADTLRVHPAASTLYRLRGKSHICAVEIEHQVEIVPYPELTLNTSADRICTGDTVLLTAAGGELYSWLGLPSGTGNYSTQDSLLYRPLATGFFPVLATTYDTLCTVVDSIFIFVDTVPIMSITGSDSGCIGRTVTLEAHSEVPIIWTSEPYDPGLDTQASMFTIVVAPEEDIRYTITGYSGLCMGSAEHQITTGLIPRAKGTAMPNRVRRGEADIELLNQSISAEGFYWVFPDSSMHYGDHYQYQIPPSWLADTFLIQLVAYRGGCADTADIPVALYNDEVWTSNVFTPNEETNNRFYVPTMNKINFHVEIFNRRGLKVYESDDPDEGWDGRSKGVLCPQATYVYRVRTSPKGSKEVNYQYGTVTLIR